MTMRKAFVFKLPDYLSKIYPPSDESCDTTLIVAGEQFRTHSIVISKGLSPVLKRLITKSQPEMDENNNAVRECELNSDFVQPEVMEKLLSFFYTSTILLTSENVKEIAKAAYYLEIACLVSACERFLKKTGSTFKDLGFEILPDEPANESIELTNGQTESPKKFLESPKFTRSESLRLRLFEIWDRPKLSEIFETPESSQHTEISESSNSLESSKISTANKESEIFNVPTFPELQEVSGKVDPVEVPKSSTELEVPTAFEMLEIFDTKEPSEIPEVSASPQTSDTPETSQIPEISSILQVSEALETLSSPKPSIPSETSDTSSESFEIIPSSDSSKTLEIPKSSQTAEISEIEDALGELDKVLEDSSFGDEVSVSENVPETLTETLLETVPETLTETLLETVPETPNRKLYCFKDNHVHCFNLTTAEWESNPIQMRTKRSFFTAALADRKIFVIGGRAPIIKNKKSNLVTTDLVEVFDCSTGEWNQLPSLPQPRRYCAAVVFEGHIYVTGGEDNRMKELSSVVRYRISDGENGSWENFRSMEKPRKDHQLIVYRNCLFAIAGTNTDPDRTIEQYEPEVGRWRVLASSQREHRAFGAAAYHGKLYMLSSEGFEFYDLDYDTRKIRPPHPGRPGKILLPVGHNQLWAFGGTDRSEKKAVHIFDLISERWIASDVLDVGTENFGVFVVKF